MREIVLKFKDGEKEFIIFKDDEKYIPCKQAGNDISFDLNQEEFNLVKYVFNKSKVTNNTIKLANVKYNEKEFLHFYDKTNDFNIFLNIDGSEISKDEYKYFNNLYNYQDDVMYSNKKGKLDENFFKKLINYGGKTLVVLLSSTMIISCGTKQNEKSDEPTFKVEYSEPNLTYIGKDNINVNEEVIVNDVVKKVELPVEEVEETKVSVPTIKKEYITVPTTGSSISVGETTEDLETHTIESISLLKYEKTDIETGKKSIVYLEKYSNNENYRLMSKIYCSSIEEKNQYLNTSKMKAIIDYALDENQNLSDEVKKEISNLSFSLSKNFEYIDIELFTERLKNLNIFLDTATADISGEYSPLTNEITIYGLNCNFNENEEALESFRKIISHELRHVTQKATNFAGLYEPMTKSLNNEAIEIDDYLGTYFDILTKVVSEESLKEYYYSGDITRLKEELMDIYNDEIDQYQLLNDFSKLYSDRYLNDYNSIETKMQELRDSENLEKDLDRLWMKKYGKPIYEDSECVNSLIKIHNIDKDALGYKCIFVLGEDEYGNPILKENQEKIVLPIVQRSDVNPTVRIAPEGYYLAKTDDPEYIGLQVRQMVENDFNNKTDELLFQRDLTPIFNGYQYLNTNDKLEGYVKIGVNEEEGNILDINIKDATGEEPDSKLRFDTEYSQYLAGELLKNQQNSQDNDIEISLNGKILTINDKTNYKIYNIDIENGTHPVLVQLLNQANISSDEYTALLNSEIQNYIYDVKNKYENYSSKSPEEVGLDNKGNIISYVDVKMNDETNINNLPITITPSDAINYTHHSNGRGTL